MRAGIRGSSGAVSGRRIGKHVAWHALRLLALSGGLLLAQSASSAADIAAGRQKAAACAVCHGPLGLSVTPDAPNLAGQPAMYLSEQLRAYRSGKRQHEVMTLMAKTLAEGDVDNVSAWFASIKLEAKAAP